MFFVVEDKVGGMFVIQECSHKLHLRKGYVGFLLSEKIYISTATLELKFLSGFPLGPENLGKWEGIFQSGKSQGIIDNFLNYF